MSSLSQLINFAFSSSPRGRDAIPSFEVVRRTTRFCLALFGLSLLKRISSPVRRTMLRENVNASLNKLWIFSMIAMAGKFVYNIRNEITNKKSPLTLQHKAKTYHPVSHALFFSSNNRV